VHIVDAKYKAHFADLDEFAWMKLADEIRDAHRADVHQVLAYASLYDAEDVTATLVYPLRQATWEALSERGRDHARADLFHGNRRVRLELRGLPFGKSQGTQG
jgi:5-methylcytosine-specific restriction endonuclease McrBC regulatory subunit McrC